MKTKDIEKKLLQLNFNLNSEGFTYWQYAITIYNNNLRMMDVYDKIAKRYNKTITQIERAMRHATITARKEIRKQYHLTYKVSNSVIFEILGRGL